MAARRTLSLSRGKAYREFVSEAEETVERMRVALADLVDQRAGGKEVEPELINRLFRCAHSLKGLAGMFGLDPMSELAHHLEDVLDGMRLGRVALDSPAVVLIDEAVALFASLLRDLEDEGAGPAAARAVEEIAARIRTAIRSPRAPEADLSSLNLDPALLRALTEYEEHRLRENLRCGRRILLVEVTFEIVSFDDGLVALSQAVREVGELLSTLPSPGATAEQQIRFGLLVATDLEAERLASRLGIPRSAVTTAHEPARASEPQAVARPPSAAAEPTAPAAGAPGPLVQADGGEIGSLKSISDTVRVDIRKLDELMNLVGELVIQRSAIGTIARRLLSDPASAQIGTELEKAHKTLDRKVRELQAGVLDVRMVPLRQVFEKLSRVVRRLRHDQDKQVRLEVRGADTELDKVLVEELVDPLMHVVRNAFDHAIESPDERSKAGKPVEGCIRIEALQRGSHVAVQVSDDGRGIDLDAVREHAERHGLVAPGQRLGRREILELVFEPGLSTRTLVTQTSGRGVGMDVVKANLTALGGAVDIDSTPGRGTTVTMTLPITLAIIQALVVGVADQRYAIPLTSVIETLLVDPAQIRHSGGREILNLRGEPLVLRRLAAEFGLPECAAGSGSNAVVIGLGDTRLGLLVDRLEGQQDAVIKPVQGPVKTVRGIAGATELGAQEPALVLDVAALIEDAFRRRQAA